MDEEKERNNDFRLRFDYLTEELEHLRTEWLDAHGKKDIERETELVRRESDLFNQINEVVKGFAGWMRQSRAA